MNIAAYCDPEGNVFWEPTKSVRHETKLASFMHSSHGVKESDI